MGLTRAEQETIIRWDEDEKVVHVYAASPVTWRKMARLGIRPHKETTMAGQPTGKFYRLPFSELRWGLKGKRRGNVGAFRKAASGNTDSTAAGVRETPATA